MDFQGAVKIILHQEGGYVNNPTDPGGQTKFGISKRSYSHIDIPLLTKEQAKEIYLRDFWKPLRCDSLPSEVRLSVFDTGINMGPSVAVKILQTVIRTEIDGIIGPKTISKAYNFDRWILITQYMTLRVILYTRMEHFADYGKGWIRRCFDIALQSGLR